VIAFPKPSAFRGALAIALLAFSTARAAAALFTPGDLIVSTYASPGAGIAQGAPSPINLLEFSPSGGSPLVDFTVPTFDGAGAHGSIGVVGQYASQSEGNIQLSGNGEYLTFASYSATAADDGINTSTDTANSVNFATGTRFSHSTVSLAQSTDTNVPRVTVLVDASGNVNSSTVLNDLYSTNNPRSVYSASGSTFYISGQGDGNDNDQGVFYGSIGINTVTNPGTTPTGIYDSHDTRFVTAYNNNLYYSIDTSSGSFTGIWKFTGLPTSAAAPTQIIPANNGKSGSQKVFYSPDGFFFANADTLYVADTGLPKAGSLGDGGIQKWTFNGSAWLLQYTLTPTTTGWVPASEAATASSGQTGFASITGTVVGTGANATVDLYATSYTIGGEDPDGLYAIADTLDATTSGGESFTELESAAGEGGQLFKGVTFAPTPLPEPTSLALLCLGILPLLRRPKAHG
jgi:hypothetical protein